MNAAATTRGDRVIGVILLALSATLLALSFGFPPPGQEHDPGTAALPRIVAVVLGLLSLALIWRPERSGPLPDTGGLVQVGAIALLSLVYALLLEPIGFVLASTGFMAAALLLIGVRRPVAIAAVSAGVAVGLHLLFAQLLEVFLPTGLLSGLPLLGAA
ncbi:tripartite tricarboxylate transporter TctB family protein [Nocardiopsis sp. HNM0947]|uniref:Tripartite tricarboxylate transporter TctB family protein n=1 Tax=Nocardiopsis coralli TaxID=2772213 RepID=A0ABR9P2W7_9ACTN|nr:tripartite tricarboxylate transporter TctB family protein [Nocardiopsis coralli]MBE2998193.1 tripartite tricarboxylate transporter TctB family protein [Nocardiopsis coralli]